MSEGNITDPPSPEHVEETERLAGELLKGPDAPGSDDRARPPTTDVEKLRFFAGLHNDTVSTLLRGAADELCALRSRVAVLALARSREAGRRQEAERERDAIIGLFVQESPSGVVAQCRFVAKLLTGWTWHATFGEATASVRKAAGLDAEPKGGA